MEMVSFDKLAVSVERSPRYQMSPKAAPDGEFFRTPRLVGSSTLRLINSRDKILSSLSTKLLQDEVTSGQQIKYKPTIMIQWQEEFKAYSNRRLN